MSTKIFKLAIFIAVTVFMPNVAFAEDVSIVPLRELTSGAIYNQQVYTEPKMPTVLPDNIVNEKTGYEEPMQEESNIKMLVKEFKLTGDMLFLKEDLLRLLQEYQNRELSYSDFNIVTDKITQYMREHDYAFASAYLPVQNIHNGIVEITIIGGKYGDINVDNTSKLKSSVIALNTAEIKKGAYIKLSELEKLALLLNDLPGVNAKINLSSGKEQGASDVNISLVDTDKLINYSLLADNYGGYYTTSEQAGVNIIWNDLGGFGERLGLQAKSSGSGLWLGAVNYNRPIGKMGANMGISYSTVNYTLGKGYAALGATGIANVASLSYIVPLKRSRYYNSYFSANFDNAMLNDNNNIGNQNQAKKVNRLILGLNGDNLDNWCGGGVMTYSFRWTNGKASMDSDYSRFLDQVAGISGEYSKVALNLSRNQKLADRLSLWLNFNGQWTNKNLVSFEDISLGGPCGVRAYPVGEASGDIGWVGNVEFRWLLPTPKSFPGALQLSAFYDQGWITVNVNPVVNGYTQPGANTMSLGGYGLGLTWSNPGVCLVNLTYAWKDGKHINTAAPDKEGQFWVSINFVF